jgi:hypothetical protein
VDDGAQLFCRGHGGVSGENALPQRIILTLEVTDEPGSFEKVRALGTRAVAGQHKPDPSSENWLATLEVADGNFIQLSAPWRG